MIEFLLLYFFIGSILLAIFEYLLNEKRLSLVTNLRMTGLWYDHGDFKTWEEFAFRFNHYYEGDSKDTRFHRLLTNREIDFVCKKFKENI